MAVENAIRERLLALKRWAHDDLVDVILPWWTSEYIMDPVNGGIYGNVSINMLRSNDEPRGLTLTGRYVYAISTVYRKFGGQIYLDRAARMYKDMVKRFYDPEFGGAFTTVTAEGEVQGTDKPNYCEAFFIMGCAAYYHATGDEEALKLAMETFDLMETKARKEPGVYYGNMTRDWKPAAGMGFGRPKRGVSASPRMSMPADMISFAHHLCQAYFRLFQATGDERVAASLRDMVNLMTDRLYDPEYRCFASISASTGKRIGTNQSFGHDCEISYLLVNIAEAVGDDAMIEKTRKVVTNICEAALERDFDPYGALYNGGDVTSDANRSPVHVWWAQAEGVSGMLVGYYLTGDEKFLTACERQADVIEKWFVNREHGDWYNNILMDETGGHVVDGMHGFDKVNSGKCPFHNSQMCMEVMERVDKILGV